MIVWSSFSLNVMILTFYSIDPLENVIEVQKLRVLFIEKCTYTWNSIQSHRGPRTLGPLKSFHAPQMENSIVCQTFFFFFFTKEDSNFNLKFMNSKWSWSLIIHPLPLLISQRENFESIRFHRPCVNIDFSPATQPSAH